MPLPKVLKTEIMDPIGASSSWRWYGYEKSKIAVGGSIISSVSGGGHFGGGLFINSWIMQDLDYCFCEMVNGKMNYY